MPSPVVNEAERSSSTLSVAWERPSEPNGLLTRYDITASPVSQSDKRKKRNNPSIVTIDIITPNQTLESVITGLHPATNYSLALTAFTDYGSYTGPVAYGLTLEDGKFIFVQYRQYVLVRA